MQIRLTVLAPRGGQLASGPAPGSGAAAPGGRAGSGPRACDVLITAPAGTALAAVASGLVSAVAGADTSGTPVLYAGDERLDAARSTLGEPPLVDGAVLSVQVPGPAGPGDTVAPVRLHVVGGPDAGGVHLLHGGAISVGRSAEADVPLDDPDVSRVHCEITVREDGGATVADLGSTNGTALDGRPVGERPVRLPTGALLRLGESALRLVPGDRTPPPLVTVPDGEGHLRIPARALTVTGTGSGTGSGAGSGIGAPPGQDAGGGPSVPAARTATGPDTPRGQAPAGQQEQQGTREASASYDPDGRTSTYGQRYGQQYGQDRGPDAPDAPVTRQTAAGAGDAGEEGRADPGSGPGGHRPRGARDGRRLGIGAWARRLTGARDGGADPEEPESPPAPEAAPVAESWPDPAAVLLTALGPGPRLWERGPGHPEELVLRLGTGDRDGLAAVPVTVALREAGSLGLAGPRARLAGLTRSALAQLAALHSPADLELVLISADRARAAAERRAEWSWLGWLPHLRPAHGQGCRLLLAYDRDQAAARLAELTRRLDDGPLGPGWPSAGRAAVDEAAARHTGPRTVVVVDGDPGTAELRETAARLAASGRAAGIHLLVLADAPTASPLSPVAAVYESACAASIAFRECGAAALLSGDVATSLRVLRTTGGLPAGAGAAATVDAVSAAWAERFGRALAPLRAEGAAPGRATALPRSARLLDELGLARATPASLMARWAQADDASGTLVLGAGPDGPLAVELTEESAHLLIEGPPGAGRTELLRAAAASLAAAARPDRLGLLLVDGAGGERGEGLGVCTELPHATGHLVANDPVRMRAFAQALGAELKRRAELLGGARFTDGPGRRRAGDRVVAQRPPSAVEQGGGAGASRGDIESPPSGTLRLRPGARPRTGAAPSDRPLPRLVVLVDDLDALVSPALGSTGRPGAGSVVRALEAVARDGARLGVHLVATSARPEHTADTELARGARLRVVLDAPPAAAGPDGPVPGRGRLGHPDGRVTAFQGGRVTGRIPRTATLRPTVVPLEWERMGDPPTRRPLRELGNGPTDLALLASALERAAHLVDAAPVPPLAPAHP
ncbi:FHA domain-containing protein [Streptomyces yaizuensis]|uniref:FHA domain-containing protein n=1 Tax=Streptomyces yaizuensis TaxID=2989713 RepID=A0ABQ5NTC1_9ACTN|nr:FHA domain-containing protein [Streptomyces sp. YSPA8]GLF93429.1 FHA domain-containing protein [Streptomyces sp. YSPA8]